MAVFRELTINWKGTDYRFVPSMKLMRSIEMGDISFTDIAVRTSQGRPPISHIAFVLSKMLSSVGCKVTDEEVYAELIGGSQDKVTDLISFVLMAFSPVEQKGKIQTPRPTASRRRGRTGAWPD
jgi:hypothetical protein